MPYDSKYMTFVEAIDWISKQEKCRRSEATRQIRTAAADKAITGACWEDERSGPTAVMDSRPDYPPTDREFWEGEASVPDDTGRVFDPLTKRRRTLLFLKNNIHQIWGESSVASESAQVGPITKAKGGRPSHRNAIYQALDELLQEQHRVKTMALAQLEALVAKKCGEQLGKTRWSPSNVRRHIPSWRAEPEQTLSRLAKTGFGVLAWVLVRGFGFWYAVLAVLAYGFGTLEGAFFRRIWRKGDRLWKSCENCRGRCASCSIRPPRRK